MAQDGKNISYSRKISIFSKTETITHIIELVFLHVLFHKNKQKKVFK